MQESKFWRVVAGVMCGGLIYIGHGLHGGVDASFPSLANTAQAGGLAISAMHGAQTIYSGSPDGKELYSWQDKGDGQVRLIGIATTESHEAELRKQKAELRQRLEQHEAERVLVHPEEHGFKPKSQTDK
jgi:hypothetical protein